MKRTLLFACFALAAVAYCSLPSALADDGGTPTTMIDAGVSAAPAPTTPTATAGTVPSLPDPTANPVATATSAWDLVKQFGYVWGGTLVLFGLGTWAVKVAGDKHWLSQDHTLPILVSLLGVLGAVLQWKFAGASSGGIAIAVMGAVLLIIQKPKAPSKTTGTTTTAPAPA